MKNLTLILLLVWALQACQPKETMPDTLPMKVAMAYGYDKFDEVSSIAYTWNVRRDSVTVMTRDWKWNIKDNTVYYATLTPATLIAWICRRILCRLLTEDLSMTNTG